MGIIIFISRKEDKNWKFINIVLGCIIIVTTSSLDDSKFMHVDSHVNFSSDLREWKFILRDLFDLFLSEILLLYTSTSHNAENCFSKISRFL